MAQIQLIFLFLFLPLVCWATDLKPWFGNNYEVEVRSVLLYQNYHSISTLHRNDFKRNENDLFWTLSAAYPFKRYCGEFEVTAADTHQQKHGGWDNFRVTERYQWLNDIERDPLSLVTGITFTVPYSRALHDISSFHHGHVEAEATLSFGQKYGYPETNNYIFRWWNVIGVGVAEEGSPWVRGDAVYEYNYADVHQFSGFVNTLWGRGKNNLHLHHFKGYGSIEHKSVDLGMRYSYAIGCWGRFYIQYARRVYAHNFPENVNLVLLEYYFHFGTQSSSNY